MKEEFEIRTMGFGELAQLYNPSIKPESASNALRRWIKNNHKLSNDLKTAGYKKYSKVLTPLQVLAVIINLGEP
jgi:hypothetical protein